MSEFVQGQRWVVDSQPELGLGLVVELNERMVTLVFPEADVERTYNALQAPLTRILFEAGDEVQPRDGDAVIVRNVHLQAGLAIYETVNGDMLVETMLSGRIKLNQPFMRLMTGQIDKPGWFQFRREFDHAMANAWSTGLKGFLGARATLIPHQLYVAETASALERVRILLADEVGLGKTIEAGLILSRLLKQERVSRVLIVVPDTLQVQWMVELIRKFSIFPMLYDGEGYDFSLSGMHIISHEALINEQENVLVNEFDMAIIDEAHRISHTSQDFAVLKLLANSLTHMVLLTATPEQLGIESHFARLGLLDPAKFCDFDAFVAQESHFQALSRKIVALPAGRNELIAEAGLDADCDDKNLINVLLDQHGVGRAVFRNVRKSIAGFPERKCVLHSLDDASWEAKFEWLAQWLIANKKLKTLVICQQAETVKSCEMYLWEKHGLDVAVFYEDQSLIERDKSAAYFADADHGARALLCSEIGSEGRNFQFSSNLVCLDLPSHPELLEQRIGRLDRIGQKNTVCIHVPCFEQAETYKQYYWYHNVLNCIEHQNPAAAVIHDKYWNESLLTFTDATESEIKTELNELHSTITGGRDALLELNSCRQPRANELCDAISLFEQNTPQELVAKAAEYFQFHYEETFEGVFSLIPSDKMLIPAIPGLPADGVELTYNREIASSREDLYFVTWDSPFIEGLWELLHHSELGTASVAMLPSKQLPAGHCLLEVCFDILIQSAQHKECMPYLSETSVRSLVLDVGEQDLAAILNETSLGKSIQPVKKQLAREVIKSRKDVLGDWLKKAEQFSEKKKQTIIDNAVIKCDAFYNNEVARLQSMQKNNALIDSADIELLLLKKDLLNQAMSHQSLMQVSAIRLIVITPLG